jgi:hypothetical protein
VRKVLEAHRAKRSATVNSTVANDRAKHTGDEGNGTNGDDGEPQEEEEEALLAALLARKAKIISMMDKYCARAV